MFVFVRFQHCLLIFLQSLTPSPSSIVVSCFPQESRSLLFEFQCTYIVSRVVRLHTTDEVSQNPNTKVGLTVGQQCTEQVCLHQSTIFLGSWKATPSTDTVHSNVRPRFHCSPDYRSCTLSISTLSINIPSIPLWGSLHKCYLAGVPRYHMDNDFRC